MKLFEIIYEDGQKFILFFKCKADAWHAHPKAYTVNEVVIT